MHNIIYIGNIKDDKLYKPNIHVLPKRWQNKVNDNSLTLSQACELYENYKCWKNIISNNDNSCTTIICNWVHTNYIYENIYGQQTITYSYPIDTTLAINLVEITDKNYLSMKCLIECKYIDAKYICPKEISSIYPNNRYPSNENNYSGGFLIIVLIIIIAIIYAIYKVVSYVTGMYSGLTSLKYKSPTEISTGYETVFTGPEMCIDGQCINIHQLLCT